MKTRLMLAATLAVALCATALPAAAASDEYDFFARAKYPGPNKRLGVDLYKVKQQGGHYAEGYQRRDVTWWPRRGVDIIEVKRDKL